MGFALQEPVCTQQNYFVSFVSVVFFLSFVHPRSGQHHFSVSCASQPVRYDIPVSPTAWEKKANPRGKQENRRKSEWLQP